MAIVHSFAEYSVETPVDARDTLHVYILRKLADQREREEGKPLVSVTATVMYPVVFNNVNAMRRSLKRNCGSIQFQQCEFFKK